MTARIEAVNSEMAEALRRLAWPSTPGESVKSCWRRLHDRRSYSGYVGDLLTPRQIRSLWEKTWKWVPAVIADELRIRRDKHERTIAAQLQATKDEYSRVWALVHQSNDPEFYSGRLPHGGEEAHPGRGKPGGAKR